jgi:hypothetical protein
VLNVVARVDGVHGIGNYSRHVSNGATKVRLYRRVDLEADFGPLGGIESLCCAVFALWAAADVEKRLHGVLSKFTECT